MTSSRADRNARNAGGLGPEIYPTQMVGTLFAGLFALEFHDLAYEVAMQADELGLVVTQRNCVTLMKFCAQKKPYLAGDVWGLALRQRAGRHLGRLAFNMFRCYFENVQLEKARSLQDDIQSNKVGRPELLICNLFGSAMG